MERLFVFKRGQQLFHNYILKINCKVNIEDDETPDSLDFSPANYSVNEQGGIVTLQLYRQINSQKESDTAVSIAYTTKDGTAKAGEDYSAVSGTLTFTPDETEQSISIPILFNSGVEEEENFEINLSEPTDRATIGVGTATVTIQDEPPGQLALDKGSYEAVEGAGSLDVTVKRSGGTVSVAYQTTDDTAQAGSDYQSASGTLTFAPGETEKTFQVATLDDSLVENDENFQLILSNFTGGAGPGTLTQTIVTLHDDEQPGQLEFSASSYSIAEDAGSVVLTVYRAGGSDGTVTVDYSTGDGTAQAGLDYEEKSGTLAFSPGVVSQTFSVNISDDRLVDIGETFNVTLSNYSGGSRPGSLTEAQVTIVDNERPGMFEFAADSYSTEEDAGSVVLTVYRTDGSDGTVTVDYDTDDWATAKGGADYKLTSGTLTFGPGETTKTITIQILDDNVVEAGEVFEVFLANPAGGAALGSRYSSYVTIGFSNERNGIFHINGTESGEEAGSVTLTVERRDGSEGTVTVDYSTGDEPLQSDRAAAGEDYQEASGTLTFGPGETSKEISLKLLDDSQAEAKKEYFQVQLSNPIGGASISQEQAVVEIIDNEKPGILAFGQDQYQVVEGGTLFITLNRTEGSDGVVGVSVESEYLTATGTDFSSNEILEVNFEPGQTSKSIELEIKDDILVEGDEIFKLTLSAPKGWATLGEPNATEVTIVDNEKPGGFGFSRAEYVVGVAEGTALISVYRTNGSDGEASVNYTTVDGTAVSGSDYTPTSGTLTFASGETSKTFRVNLADKVQEDFKTVSLLLSEPTNLTSLGPQNSATLTIHPAVGKLQFEKTKYISQEDGGSLAITVQRIDGNYGEVAVDISAGGAKVDTDYSLPVSHLSFKDGETSKTFSLNIIDNNLLEDDKTLLLDLNNPTGGSKLGSPRSAVVSIVDDDDQGIIQFSQPTYYAAEGSDALITVERTGSDRDRIVAVSYTTKDGIALAGTDYLAASGTLEFGQGETSKSFTVEISDDSQVERNKQLELVISNPTNGVVLGELSKSTLVISSNDLDFATPIHYADSNFLQGQTYNKGYHWSEYFYTKESEAKADFNGDGRSDVSLIKNTAQGTIIHISLARDDGSLSEPQTLLNGKKYWYTKFRDLEAGDFNGDDRMDLAYVLEERDRNNWSDSDHYKYYLNTLIGNGDGSFQEGEWKLLDQPVYGITGGDFNSDGLTDLVGSQGFHKIFKGYSNERLNYKGFEQISFFLGTGNGTLIPANKYSIDHDYKYTGDFDDDGIPDIAVRFLDLYGLENGYYMFNNQLAFGSFSFDSSSYQVAEENESLTVTVNRIGNKEGEAWVDYKAEDGSPRVQSEVLRTK